MGPYKRYRKIKQNRIARINRKSKPFQLKIKTNKNKKIRIINKMLKRSQHENLANKFAFNAKNYCKLQFRKWKD